MNLFIGVDAGASHTEVVVADASLQPVARRRGAPGAVRPDRVTQAAGAIVHVVRDAIAGTRGTPAALVVGAAGAGRESERARLEGALASALGEQLRIQVTTDAAIALEAAFGDGPGIVLNAGSGSIATARDTAGVVWRAGGLGWQLGDDGSGYALGRAALAALARAADGRGPATSLSTSIPAKLGATELDDVVRWAHTAGPNDVAALAQVACEDADRGDGIAHGIVERCAHDLLLHLTALLPRFPGSGRARVALAGGLLSPESAVRRALIQRIEHDLPRIQVVTHAVDAPLGAVAMAARLV